MEVCGRHHVPPAVPTRKNFGARRKGGRVGPQGVRTFRRRGKPLVPAGSRNPGQSIPYPSHYTNWATPAPCKSRVLTQTSDSLSQNPSCLTKHWHNTFTSSSAVDFYVRLARCTASMCGRWPTFRDIHVVSSSRVETSKRSVPALSLSLSVAEHLTNSMQHSPSWEADRFSASQEIPRILWNPKVHYRSPPVPMMSQLNPVHVLHPTYWRSILILL
jgi:hypothetical protein